MNLLLLEAGEIEGRRAVVTGRRARHAVGVIGARTGETLRVGVARGGVGRAVVERADPERLELEVGELSSPPPPPPVELVLALPRPKALSRLLQDAASLGVKRVDLVNAWRVSKTFFASHRLTPEALAEELVLGCEQGGHTWIPEIAVHPLLMPFLRGPLATRARERRLVVFDPRAPFPLEGVVAPGADDPVIAAIGPEGGWIARELEALERIGGRLASMGEGVLRTEVATVAALAQLALLRRLVP